MRKAARGRLIGSMRLGANLAQRASRDASRAIHRLSVRALLKGSFILLLALVGLAVLLVSASFYTFNALTQEAVIAELRFTPIASRHYLAHLRTGDFCAERVLPLYGDQWRIDAEFVKWKYWASLLGFEPLYRLDRLEGRYRAIDEQNTGPLLAHDLGQATSINFIALADSLGRFNFLLDATYGSSTYHDIDTSAVFRVYRTETGIITRRMMPEVPQRTDEGLPIEITRGCGEPQSGWQRVATWADARVMRVIDLAR